MFYIQEITVQVSSIHGYTQTTRHMQCHWLVANLSGKKSELDSSNNYSPNGRLKRDTIRYKLMSLNKRKFV